MKSFIHHLVYTSLNPGDRPLACARTFNEAKTVALAKGHPRAIVTLFVSGSSVTENPPCPVCRPRL